MNAKELRACAVHAVDDLVCDHRLNGDKIMQMCQYILATVREDDGEPLEWKWLATVLNAGISEQDAKLFEIGNYLTINEVSNARGNLHEVYCHFQKVATIKTRGQFRSLCRGLGIDMKEPH